MIRITLTSAMLVAAMPVFAAPLSPVDQWSQDSVHRVDPGKTLKLIKRIRDAGDGHIAS